MTNNIDKQSFGQGGCELVSATSAIPAGQYCAIAFIGGGGAITTSFSAAEAPLLGGTQTSKTFPDGFVLFTPLVIKTGSTARINCPIVAYKAVTNF
jgi:hypothetical protein